MPSRWPCDDPNGGPQRFRRNLSTRAAKKCQHFFGLRSNPDPKMAPKGPQIVRNVHKMTLREPKMAPGGAQGGSRSPPDGPTL